MRKEPYGVGSFVHITKRGGRGNPIVKDKEDRDRFLLMLAHFNDEYLSDSWYYQSLKYVDRGLKRPLDWPKKEPLVEIVAFCLLDTHFHLLLKETQEGGISRFMQKLGMGMTNSFNLKYGESGSIFQGSYRSKTIEDNTYLRYVLAYIQVKNSFEMYPQGYEIAVRNFDIAFAWAIKYVYCSLSDFLHISSRGILSTDSTDGLFSSDEYKQFSRDFVIGRKIDELKLK